MQSKDSCDEGAFIKMIRSIFDELAGIFSLKKHFPGLDRNDMRRISVSFADENFRRLPAMAALGLLFSVVFIITDIRADFYRLNFPVSVLNIIFEGLYFFAGLAAVEAAVQRTCRGKQYLRNSRS